MSQKKLDKEEVRQYARDVGAALVGFAPVERWAEFGDLPEAFFPQQVWPLTRTVIVLAIPSLLPTVETKISHLYRAQYNYTNQLLDEAAYRLAAFLNRQGQAAIPFCRDGYGVGVLQEKPLAAFSHVWAGQYAGLGRIGWNHTLLTPEYGPRHRLVSVLTALKVPGDPLLEKELCTNCRLCEKICSTQAFSGSPQEVKYAKMDKISCAKRRQRFRGPFSHCGFCIKVCPIGEDRALYGSRKIKQYFTEAQDFSQWQSGIGAGITGWEE